LLASKICYSGLGNTIARCPPQVRQARLDVKQFAQHVIAIVFPPLLATWPE
jgi:hypothetical protein